MVETVRIPLSVLNNIPGPTGVEDVTFDVPQVEDLEEIVDDAVLGLDDVTDAVADEVDRVVDDVIDGIEDELPEVDVPGADVVADAVLDRLDVDEGLFGPIEEPLDAVIRDAVLQGLEQLDGLDVDLGALGGEDLLDVPEIVEDVRQDVQDALDTLDRLEESVGDGPQLEFPDVEQIVTDALAEVEPEVGGAGFFTDPVGFLANAALAALDEAIDDDLQQELRDVTR